VILKVLQPGQHALVRAGTQRKTSTPGKIPARQVIPAKMHKYRTPQDGLE
jgi:hypothetical protein